MTTKLFKAAALACVIGWAGAGVAKADLIDGQISIFGTNVVDLSTNTIKFLPGSSFTTLFASTGDFTPFGVVLNPVTMRNENVVQGYTPALLTVGSNLTCGTGGVIGGCFFQTTLGGVTAGFDLDAYTVDETNGLAINGTGIAYLTGFDPTPGFFQFTTQATGGVNISFSATAAVPGPIVGAGLPGLLVACLGLIALARRRRIAA
jgi:hypothetical protein